MYRCLFPATKRSIQGRNYNLFAGGCLVNIPAKFYRAMQGHMGGGEEIFFLGGASVCLPEEWRSCYGRRGSEGIFPRENFEI